MDYTCNFLYFHAPFIIIELIKSFVTFVLPCLTPTLKYKYYFLWRQEAQEQPAVYIESEISEPCQS